MQDEFHILVVRWSLAWDRDKRWLPAVHADIALILNYDAWRWGGEQSSAA